VKMKAKTYHFDGLDPKKGFSEAMFILGKLLGDVYEITAPHKLNPGVLDGIKEIDDLHSVELLYIDYNCSGGFDHRYYYFNSHDEAQEFYMLVGHFSLYLADYKRKEKI
jgi:hypothetical protein